MINADLLTSGLVLVPIPLGQKGPLKVNWNLRQNCISDVAVAGRLADMNVGLAHAYCTPSPTCAIDIDHYIQAKAWLSTHGIDLEPLLYANDAVVIWSGKRLSLKLLYRLPPGMPPLKSKKINGLDGKSILEFRCATKDQKTVQDVLPPSIHPDGHQYQWMGAGNPLSLPTLPLSLLKVWGLLIANSSRVSQRMFGTPATSSRPETPRQIALVEEALLYINADCPYETWRNVVWAVLSTGWKRAEAIAQAWSSSAPDRYNDDAFWLVANSYMPTHSNPISLGTVYHHARAGGWHG
jgi:hypothetical protein